MLTGTLSNAQNRTCPVDRWGPPDCQNVCGECFVTESARKLWLSFLLLFKEKN